MALFHRLFVAFLVDSLLDRLKAGSYPLQNAP